MKKNVRCYSIQTFHNEKKDETINSLYNEYKKFYGEMILIQYRHYQKTGYLNKNIDTKKYSNKLSERYRRCVVYQVVGQLQSWLSNRNNKITDIIHQCESLTDKEKRILHIIKNNPDNYEERTITILKKKTNEIKEELTITKELIQIYKSILRSVKWSLPSNKNIGMQLNNNVVQFVSKKRKHKKQKAAHFNNWFELSTLIKGQKVYIPSTINPYLKEQLGQGKLLNAVRINFKNNKPIFNLTIDKEIDEDYESEIDSIGIDFGTKHLFALSTGNIFGVNFGKQLKSYDTKISLLQKRLQHQGLKPNSSKRYRRLVFKCREFIKNEINRNFNKIIKELKPQEIVLERLDFKHSKLNKTMNRILRKCGRSVIKSKIQMLEKDYGIKIVEVNPAYTSQKCNKCGFVHKKQ